MATRAGRAFKTLHNKIERLEVINRELLEMCKLAVTYLEDGAWRTALDRLQQAVAKTEGK